MLSGRFTVLNPRVFPGMAESTALTRHLVSQGMKAQLRQKTRISAAAREKRYKILEATTGSRRRASSLSRHPPDINTNEGDDSRNGNGNSSSDRSAVSSIHSAPAFKPPPSITHVPTTRYATDCEGDPNTSIPAIAAHEMHRQTGGDVTLLPSAAFNPLTHTGPSFSGSVAVPSPFIHTVASAAPPTHPSQSSSWDPPRTPHCTQEGHCEDTPMESEDPSSGAASHWASLLSPQSVEALPSSAAYGVTVSGVDPSSAHDTATSYARRSSESMRWSLVQLPMPPHSAPASSSSFIIPPEVHASPLGQAWSNSSYSPRSYTSQSPMYTSSHPSLSPVRAPRATPTPAYAADVYTEQPAPTSLGFYRYAPDSFNTVGHDAPVQGGWHALPSALNPNQGDRSLLQHRPSVPLTHTSSYSSSIGRDDEAYRRPFLRPPPHAGHLLHPSGGSRTSDPPHPTEQPMPPSVRRSLPLMPLQNLPYSGPGHVHNPGRRTSSAISSPLPGNHI